MNDLLNKLYGMIKPQNPMVAATSPMTSSQLGMLNRVLGLTTQQAQGAMEQTPEKLAQSRAMLEQYTPGQPMDPRLLEQFMNLAGFGSAGITAYHGSPYLFRMLDRSRVGTGEGAQAYGVGAGYAAEARPVAESYKTAGPGGFLEREADKLLFSSKNIDDAISAAQKELNSVKNNKAPQTTIDEVQGVLGVLKNRKLGAKESGYLYKGDIPDEILPKFLDWDKPISQQSLEVQKAIGKDVIEDVAKAIKISPDKLTGGQLYTRNYRADTNLMPIGINKTALEMETEWLESKGIRGIRYLDQGSRGEGKGTSNFIPFRAEDYKIQEINDIPIEDWISKGLLGS